jgi:hypothetical protein
MDEQAPQNQLPQALPPQPAQSSGRPAFDASQIYPDATKTQKLPSDGLSSNSDKSSAISNYPPLGVMIISLVILLQSLYGLWLSATHSHSGVYIVIYALQLLLGLGLLTLHEIARLIYVALGVISLCLQVPALLFFTGVSRLSGGYKLYAWVLVGVEVFILVYLTRPSIKSHFG